jgi:N-methylhydantoinase A
MGYRIGVDIGGTFTDLALFDDDGGEALTHKLLTTPADPAEAVIEGVCAIAEKAGIQVAAIDAVAHGTTLVTNAVIERKGTPTALVVTEGFADVLDIGLERRYDLFDLRIRFPAPIVPRHLRIELAERVRHDGRITVRPDLAALETPLRDAVERHGVQGVAVCLLHSYANPTHERATGEWIARHFPGLHVSLSSTVFPYMREYERWVTTCLNAYVQPVVDRYLRRLEEGLSDAGFAGRFLIMSSSGGTLDASIARDFPIRLLESGPAAGALMSARAGQAIGAPNLLSFDMGGTTAKGCIIRDGAPSKRYDLEVARVHEFKAGSGLPAKIPVLDMIEIGAGGGSLASIDSRGALAMGPRSAGADPGPACYGRGGTAPTLTDANLLLGYLGADSFLGGRMRLDTEAARQAIARHVATPLGVELLRAAWGMHEVINEDVARAFRVHASERGVDYRRCSMVVFGGSGPLHGARVARKLRIPEVVCPAGAGVMSAFGLLSSPPAFETVVSHRALLAQLDAGQFARIMAELEDRAAAALGRGGVQRVALRFARRLDMRYAGQGYEVEVTVPEAATPEATLDALPEAFARAYAAVFGLALKGNPIEVVNWKVEAVGPVPGGGRSHRLEGFGGTGTAVALKGRRPAWFPEEGGLVDCPVLDRYALSEGAEVQGPALVEERESTCVLGPRDRLRVDPQMNLVISVG